MKKCIKCNIEKKFAEFRKAKANKDGFTGICKICLKINVLNNNEYYKKYNKEYALNNLEKLKEYQLKNKSKRKEYISKYHRERKIIDPLFKLRCNISTLIYCKFKQSNGYTKKSKTYEYLGCTFIEFKAHLEKQFTDGMTWENQGQWHLDHIYPVSLAKDEEHLIKLNHYTNFQPLWAVDNIKKGNKI